jgi:hypothetical protein
LYEIADIQKCAVSLRKYWEKSIYAVGLHIALIKQFYAHDVNHVSEEVLHSQQMK